MEYILFALVAINFLSLLALWKICGYTNFANLGGKLNQLINNSKISDGDDRRWETIIESLEGIRRNTASQEIRLESTYELQAGLVSLNDIKRAITSIQNEIQNNSGSNISLYSIESSLDRIEKSVNSIEWNQKYG